MGVKNLKEIWGWAPIEIALQLSLWYSCKHLTAIQNNGNLASDIFWIEIKCLQEYQRPSCNAISVGAQSQIRFQIFNPHPEQWKLIMKMRFKKISIHVTNSRLAIIFGWKSFIKGTNTTVFAWHVYYGIQWWKKPTLFLSTVCMSNKLTQVTITHCQHFLQI